MATTIALHDSTRERLAIFQKKSHLPSMDAVVLALLDAPLHTAQAIWSRHRSAALEVCNRRGILRAVAFGSRVWGTPHGTSDFDLMVEFERTPDLWTYQDIAEELEQALGVHVDMHTPRGLRPRLLARIEAEGARLLG